MIKPSLLTRKWSNQAGVEAECRSCGPAVSFFVSARGVKPENNIEELQDAFEGHFKEMHLRGATRRREKVCVVLETSKL